MEGSLKDCHHFRHLTTESLIAIVQHGVLVSNEVAYLGDCALVSLALDLQLRLHLRLVRNQLPQLICMRSDHSLLTKKIGLHDRGIIANTIDGFPVLSTIGFHLGGKSLDLHRKTVNLRPQSLHLGFQCCEAVWLFGDGTWLNWGHWGLERGR